MNLREALTQYSLNWRDDLSANWRSALASTSPNALGVLDTLTFATTEPCAVPTLSLVSRAP